MDKRFLTQPVNPFARYRTMVIDVSAHGDLETAAGQAERMTILNRKRDQSFDALRKRLVIGENVEEFCQDHISITIERSFFQPVVNSELTIKTRLGNSGPVAGPCQPSYSHTSR